MSARIRITGDSPHNERDERGSKRSCLVHVAGLAGFVVAAILAVAGCKPATDAPPTSTTSAHCEEDEPCWDCTRMGNQRCDPKGQDL